MERVRIPARSSSSSSSSSLPPPSPLLSTEPPRFPTARRDLALFCLLPYCTGLSTEYCNHQRRLQATLNWFFLLVRIVCTECTFLLLYW